MDDIAKLAARFMKWDAHSAAADERSLMRAGKVVQRRVRGAIGTYEFGWPPLSPATIARKRRGDTPLLETGEQRDSYGVNKVDRETVEVGSSNPKATWSELGTSRAPPRPVLVPAAQAEEQNVVAILGSGALETLELKKPD